jgi:predicted permease
MSFLFWRRKREAELDDEIDSHLKMAARERVERGESSAQAEVSARRELGSIGLVKEVTRDVWGWRWIADVVQDVRCGLRMLRKSPGFTAVAVLTLALGIGANAAIFSILDPLLLRKLPVQNPDELVLVRGAGSIHSEDGSEYSSYLIYRDNNTILSGVFAAGDISNAPVMSNGQTLQVEGEPVSGNFFSVLGVRPYLGRLLDDSDGRPAAGEPVVVLSFNYWRYAFDANNAVVGKTILIRGAARTIVGVTPPGFFGVDVGRDPSFYIPIGSSPKSDAWWVWIFGRLKPGLSLAQAQAGLDPIFKQAMLASSLPEIEKQQDMSRLVLDPAARGLSQLREKFSLSGRILMAVVTLVLLIACSNVASLLLARGTARRKEITVRLALGAGRWRLVRQLLTESALIGLIGAAFGLLAAAWASRILVTSLSAENSHIPLAAGVNGRVLLFSFGVLVLSVLLFGLAPALAATCGGLAQGLKVQSSSIGAKGRRSLLLKSPVVIQVAVCVAVLTGAGLLLHSLYNLETADVGFDRNNVIAVSFSCCADRTPDRSLALYNQIIAKAKSLPGVQSAGIASYSQTNGLLGINVAVEGFAPRSVGEQHVFFNAVSSGYFETLEIPILSGRDFMDQDNANAPFAAIINRTMARHYFGETNPIGKRFRFVEGKWPPIEIIGVAADSVYNDMREETPDYVYVKRQQLKALHPTPGVGGVLDVRASGNAKLLAGPLRDLIRSFDSTATITSIKTLREQIDLSLHPDRLIAALCSIFSALALVLTCIGLYGTLSFSVAQRTNEIGIRMALGARPGNIFGLMIGQGMRLVIVGLVIGAAGALASASLLAKLLFGVKGSDPVTFVGVSVVLMVAAILACYLPARRAMRVDPMVALRDE